MNDVGAPVQFTFSDRHPSSLKADARLVGGVLTVLFVSFVFSYYLRGFAPEGATQLGIACLLAVFAYLVYRETKHGICTVRVYADRVEVQRRLALLPFITTTATLPRQGLTVGAVPSASWWIPKELPLMTGDNIQHFSDLAFTYTDATGAPQRVLIGRDRVPNAVMLARKTAIDQLLRGGLPTGSGSGVPNLGPILRIAGLIVLLLIGLRVFNAAVDERDKPWENQLVDVYGRVTPRPKTNQEHQREIAEIVEKMAPVVPLEKLYRFEVCTETPIIGDFSSVILSDGKGLRVHVPGAHRGGIPGVRVGKVERIEGAFPQFNQGIEPGAEVTIDLLDDGQDCRATNYESWDK